MQSDGKRVTRETSRATGTFLFSRRAHLLTTPVGRWYFLRKPCAPRGGMRLLRKPDGQCHISADLLSLSTQLVCGKRSQNSVASTDGIPPTARTNLPQHKALPPVAAALFAVMTISLADSHFLFATRNRNLTKGCERANGDLSFGN